MAKQLTKIESQNHKNQALAELDDYLSYLIDNNNQAKKEY